MNSTVGCSRTRTRDGASQPAAGDRGPRVPIEARMEARAAGRWTAWARPRWSGWVAPAQWRRGSDHHHRLSWPQPRRVCARPVAGRVAGACPLTRSAPRRQSSYVRVLAEESKLLDNRKRQLRVQLQVQQLEEEMAQLKAEDEELGYGRRPPLPAPRLRPVPSCTPGCACWPKCARHCGLG